MSDTGGAVLGWGKAQFALLLKTARRGPRSTEVARDRAMWQGGGVGGEGAEDGAIDGQLGGGRLPARKNFTARGYSGAAQASPPRKHAHAYMYMCMW